MDGAPIIEYWSFRFLWMLELSAWNLRIRAIRVIRGYPGLTDLGV
jgi:hypothetical protein